MQSRRDLRTAEREWISGIKRPSAHVPTRRRAQRVKRPWWAFWK